MFQRLKTLIALQLNFGKFMSALRDKKKTFVAVMLRILAVVIITVAMYFVLYFFKSIMHLEIKSAFLLFVVGILQILSILANTNALVDELYLSKDNAMLFAYPARHSEIFFSKIAVFYIKEFIKNLYFLIPLLFAFGIYTSADVFYFLNMFILLFVLPLFPVLIGALLSMPFMYIKRALKAFPIVQTVVYLGIFGGICYMIVRFMAQLPKPLRILALYNSFINAIKDFMVQFNSYLFFYRNTVFTLFEFRSYYDYLIMFGVIIVLLLVVYALAMPLYFRIVSHFSENAIIKRHKTYQVKSNSTFLAFLIKECRVILRTPGKLFSYLSFAISFPFLMYVMNTIFMAINTSALGDVLIIAFNVIIALVLITASNTMSAVALSSEGEEFAVLKTAPSKTYKIAYAKIVINFFFSTLGIIAGMIVLGIITTIDSWQICLLFFTLLFVNTAHIFWSFQLDIVNPQLKNFAQTGNVNHNPNVAKSLLYGILLSVLFGGVSMFFFFDNLVGGWTRVVIMALVFLALRVFLFYANLKVYFKRIEL